jgi:haloalkane dehalogenase
MNRGSGICSATVGELTEKLSFVELNFQLSKGTFPFESRFIEINGNRVHFVDEGVGPVMLMLHGNPTWSFLYRGMIARLKSHYRCIAIDYPGFGLSVPVQGYTFLPKQHSQVVEAFVERLGLAGITLFVQDWGGPIGLGFAGRRPDLIFGVVISNSFAWAEKDLVIKAWSRLFGGPLGRVTIKGFNALARMLPVLLEGPTSAEVARAYRAPFPSWASREGIVVFIRECLLSNNYLSTVEKGLDRLADKPVLLLWGEKEFTGKLGHIDRFARLLPQAHTRILEGVGHFSPEDAPERMSRAVLEWRRSNQ